MEQISRDHRNGAPIEFSRTDEIPFEDRYNADDYGSSARPLVSSYGIEDAPPMRANPL
jgi:hypothetical protein